MEDGTYKLRVTTQYTSGGILLKTPRSIVKTLTIGEAPDPVISDGDGGDDGESPDTIV